MFSNLNLTMDGPTDKKTTSPRSAKATTKAKTPARRIGRPPKAKEADPVPVKDDGDQQGEGDKDKIKVVVYYPTKGGAPSPQDIHDCHICGQKFRYLSRIKLHYLKKHGCVVMVCGPEKGSEPQISCPQQKETRSTTSRRKKVQEAEAVAKFDEFAPVQTPKLPESVTDVKMEPETETDRPVEPEAESKDLELPSDDGVGIGMQVDDTDGQAPAPPNTPESQPNDSSSKAGPVRRRKRKGWGNRAAKKNSDLQSKKPTVSGPTFTSTPGPAVIIKWEVKMDTPAPGKLKLKKGRPCKSKGDPETTTVVSLEQGLHTPGTPATLNASSSSTSSNSGATSARNARYAKRTAAKETNVETSIDDASMAASRKLELMEMEIKKEPETVEEVQKEEEECPLDNVKVKMEPELPSEEFFTPKSAVNPENSFTSTPKDPEKKESIAPEGPEPEIGDETDLFSFLARESGFGHVNLTYTGNTLDLSLDAILDDLLTYEATVEEPASAAAPYYETTSDLLSMAMELAGIEPDEEAEEGLEDGPQLQPLDSLLEIEPPQPSLVFNDSEDVDTTTKDSSSFLETRKRKVFANNGNDARASSPPKKARFGSGSISKAHDDEIDKENDEDSGSTEDSFISSLGLDSDSSLPLKLKLFQANAESGSDCSPNL